MTKPKKLGPVTAENLRTAFPPGLTVREELAARNQTFEDFANASGLDMESVESLIRGDLPVTAELAIRLESYFGASAAFWLNKERMYRESTAAGKPVAGREETLSGRSSGKFSLRLPVSLYDRVVKAAQADGVSVNTMLVSIVAEGVGRRSQASGPN